MSGWKPGQHQGSLQKEIFVGASDQMNERCIRLYWDPEPTDRRTKPWSCAFAIFPIITYAPDGRREYFASEEQELSGGLTQNIEDAWPQVDGSVKWDGCTEIYFKQEHFCGADDLAEFFETITIARNAAIEVVREESDGWVT